MSSPGRRPGRPAQLMIATAAVFALGCAAAQAVDPEFAPLLSDLAKTKIRALAQDPELVAAVKAQNLETSGYDQAKIDALDKKWRAEVDSDSKPLIDTTLGSAASRHVIDIVEKAQGLYTEMFLTDDKGLNVAQSGITSDYWQGDEAKWQKTFLVGPDAVDISNIDQDESTQVFQSQVSVTVVDPDTGAPIGALTVGVDVSQL